MKRNADRIIRVIGVMFMALALTFGSFVMIPGNAYAADSSDIAVGDFVKIGNEDVPGYAGTPLWRVLDKDPADGSMLLMSEYLWKGNGTGNAEAGIRFNPKTGSEGFTKDINGQVFHWRGTAAEAWCDAFYDAVLKDVDGLVPETVTLSDEEYTYTQTLYPGYNKQIGFKAVSTMLYESKVFFLSAEELAGYEDAPGYIADPVQRVAYMPGSETAEQWLLRSTVLSPENQASEVKADGEIAAVTANTGRAARPALWVSFAEGTAFKATEDESGSKTWEISEGQTDPSEGDQTEPSGGSQDDPSNNDQEAAARKAAEEKAKATPSVTVSGSTVTAESIAAAIAATGGSPEYVTELVLDKSVRKIRKNAFAGTKVTTLTVQTKKLKKKSVKGSLRGSSVTTVKVQVGNAKTNKKYVKKYKKFFTRKNAGKKAKVKK